MLLNNAETTKIAHLDCSLNRQMAALIESDKNQ